MIRVFRRWFTSYEHGQIIEFMQNHGPRLGVLDGAMCASDTRMKVYSRDGVLHRIDRGMVIHVWSSSHGLYTPDSLKDLHQSASGFLFYDFADRISKVSSVFVREEVSQMMESFHKACTLQSRQYRANSESCAKFLFGEAGTPVHTYLAAKLLGSDFRFSRAEPERGYKALVQNAVFEKIKKRFAERMSSWKNGGRAEPFLIEARDVPFLAAVDRLIQFHRHPRSVDVRGLTVHEDSHSNYTQSAEMRNARELLAALDIDATDPSALQQFLELIDWYLHPLRPLDHRTFYSSTGDRGPSPGIGSQGTKGTDAAVGAKDVGGPTSRSVSGLDDVESAVADESSCLEEAVTPMDHELIDQHAEAVQSVSKSCQPFSYAFRVPAADIKPSVPFTDSVQRVTVGGPVYCIDRRALGSLADDAFSVELPHILYKEKEMADPDSRWIWSHVADVTRIVRPESLLAKYSLSRLRTIYPMHGTPSFMLPAQHAAQLALSTTSRNHVLSFGARISSRGELLNYKVQCSDVGPIQRYSFQEVMHPSLCNPQALEPQFRNAVLEGFELLNSWVLRDPVLRELSRMPSLSEKNAFVNDSPAARVRSDYYNPQLFVRLLGTMAAYVADLFASDRHVVLPRVPAITVTAPLRRFQDLCAHMQVRSVLEGAKRPPFSLEEIRNVERSVMEQSRRIRDASFMHKRALAVDGFRQLCSLFRLVSESDEVYLPAVVLRTEAPRLGYPIFRQRVLKRPAPMSNMPASATSINTPSSSASSPRSSADEPYLIITAGGCFATIWVDRNRVALEPNQKIIIRVKALSVREGEVECEYVSDMY
ncbi:mitochondrial RNB domain-containing protein [Andalucia godoyi]|uniref:Mitochondrial RNB domain-containing protein n=1 Tax=Andalucia godoyi TaxID=505711 RepID=A0A8K0AI42_ANDGO|nr:mitochondrial RNB domain-containing protein [Andalucia godoyi]|eukprot:ANDGO_01056.mRNA.1 mitochondrial RNB domain-containing protein